jgi:hypothetical protein
MHTAPPATLAPATTESRSAIRRAVRAVAVGGAWLAATVYACFGLPWPTPACLDWLVVGGLVTVTVVAHRGAGLRAALRIGVVVGRAQKW